jgi:hypothetical protein
LSGSAAVIGATAHCSRIGGGREKYVRSVNIVLDLRAWLSRVLRK